MQTQGKGYLPCAEVTDGIGTAHTSGFAVHISTYGCLPREHEPRGIPAGFDELHSPIQFSREELNQTQNSGNQKGPEGEKERD
jgi:hypothetical protein